MSDEIRRRLIELGGAARRHDILRGRRDAGLSSAHASRARSRRAVGPWGLRTTRDAVAEAVAAAVHGGVDRVRLGRAARRQSRCSTCPSARTSSSPRSRGRSPSRLRDETPVILHRESWLPDGHRPGVAVVPRRPGPGRMVVCCPAREAVVAARQCAAATAHDDRRDPWPRACHELTSARRVVLALADGRKPVAARDACAPRAARGGDAASSRRRAGADGRRGRPRRRGARRRRARRVRVPLRVGGSSTRTGDATASSRCRATSSCGSRPGTSCDDRDRLVATVRAALGAPRRRAKRAHLAALGSRVTT